MRQPPRGAPRRAVSVRQPAYLTVNRDVTHDLDFRRARDYVIELVTSFIRVGMFQPECHYVCRSKHRSAISLFCVSLRVSALVSVFVPAQSASLILSPVSAVNWCDSSGVTLFVSQCVSPSVSMCQSVYQFMCQSACLSQSV